MERSVPINGPKINYPEDHRGRVHEFVLQNTYEEREIFDLRVYTGPASGTGIEIGNRLGNPPDIRKISIFDSTDPSSRRPVHYDRDPPDGKDTQVTHIQLREPWRPGKTIVLVIEFDDPFEYIDETNKEFVKFVPTNKDGASMQPDNTGEDPGGTETPVPPDPVDLILETAADVMMDTVRTVAGGAGDEVLDRLKERLKERLGEELQNRQ